MSPIKSSQKFLQTDLNPLSLDSFPLFKMAFVPGRNIHEKTSSLMKLWIIPIRKKKKTGFIAIQVDLTKAFDKVEWNLLSNILANVGFCKKFC